MTTLLSVDVELLAQILEYVDDTSPNTTKSIALVNKYFHSIAKLVAHRRKKLAYATSNGKFRSPNLRQLLEDDSVLRGIRYLTVDSRPWTDQDQTRLHPGDHESTETASEEVEEHRWGDLGTLIGKLGNLKTLTWNLWEPIPKLVLDALHKHHTKAELRLNHWCRSRFDLDHKDAAEIALAKSPALTAIRAQVWTGGSDPHPDLRIAAFQRILASAPNLRFASLVTGHQGCVMRGFVAEEMDQLQEAQSKFFTRTKPNPALRHLTLDGFGLSSHTLDVWGQYVDLTKLESFKCSRGLPDVSYFDEAAGVLTNLKQVSLNFGYQREPDMKKAAEHYIATCSPLQSLSLWSWMGIIPLDTILSQHGATLETLQLHERETLGHHFDQEPRKCLSVDDLKSIKKACPKIRDFTFDLNRQTADLTEELDSKGYRAVFEELASWPSLSKIQIYYDLGLAFIANMRVMYGDDSDGEDEDQHEEGIEEADGPQEASESATPSPKRRKTKRDKPKILQPSTNQAIQDYLPKLWKATFGDRPAHSPRSLDVKFGEWERKMGGGYPAPWVIAEQHCRTYWEVRPHERDDSQDCVLKRHGTGAEENEDETL